MCERVLCFGGCCENEWEEACKGLGTVSGVSLMCGTVSSRHSPALPGLGSHQDLLRQVLLLLFLGSALCCQAGLGSCWAWGHQSHCGTFYFPPASPSCWRNPCPCAWSLCVFGSCCRLSSIGAALFFLQASQHQPCHFPTLPWLLFSAYLCGGWVFLYLHFVSLCVWDGPH